MIKVGIFWVIGGKVFPYAEERESEKLNEREKLSGKIDSNFEHFKEWDTELALKFPYADFATYPRGRVMYDVVHNRHIVYADKCIQENEIGKIVTAFAISDFTIERDEHYQCDKCISRKLSRGKDEKITYKILDGENRIGANLIELRCNGKRYLIECGTELEPTEEGVELRRKIAGKHYSVCFVTHYHGDHAGLLSEPLNCDAIYMGGATMRILNEIGGICRENSERIVTFTSGEEISFNGMTITPYLCDHSAYDSYMFFFKSARNSILYTGDFRANGRKNFDAFLRTLPKSADTIICEGTNMKNVLPPFTEKDLEEKLVGIFSGDRPIFVLQSATNIDRIVSVYRAAIRTDRAFVMRLTQARICELLPNIPQPNGFKRCYTYPEFGMDDEKFDELQSKYGNRFVGKEWLLKTPRFVLEVTSRSLSYIKKLSEMTDLTGATLIYSTWMGYTEREDMKAFLDGVKELGINIEYIHASGHADVATIDRLLNTVQHKELQFVHKEL